MLKSSRKKLIAIGCSFTRYRGTFTRHMDDFPEWPTHLAQELDMECVNLGWGGVGNEYISAKLIDTILSEKKKDIGLVVLMWSGWQRMDFEDINNNWYRIRPSPDNRQNIKNPVAFLNIQNPETIIMLNTIMLKYNNAHNATMKSLRHFLIAQRLLEDIPYLMMQGIEPIHRTEFLEEKSKDIWLQSFLNSKIFDEIDEKKFIGWPIMQEIGGYTVGDILNKIDPEQKELRISAEDRHPNDEGHKIMAQEIYNAYEKNYL
jgi:hypothetical protein